MARLTTSIPLNITNEVFGVILDLGELSRAASEFRFDNGSIIFEGETFTLDTVLRGSNLTSGTAGRITGVELIFNEGERSFVFDEFNAGIVQVANALDGNFNNIVRLVGGGADEFFGSQGDDKMRSFGGDDLIEGRGGNDSLIADGGNDNVIAGAGNDSIFAGAGNDSVDGGDGDDFLSLSGGNDTAFSGSGDDTINGQGGNDRIIAGGGADSINGGGGADTISGQSGRDFIKGGGRGDVIMAGGGSDTVRAGGGEDVVRGNGGRDLIDGGAGADLLIGGGGRDTFSFRNNAGDDIVRDFMSGKDKLDLSALRAIDDFADLIANHVSDNGDDLLIAITGSSEVTIENISIADLNQNDFIF